MVRSFGCLDDPNTIASTWQDWDELGSIPAQAVSWRSRLVDLVYDQGSTNACVGHALANAIAQCVRCRVGIESFERPSALHIYDMARGNYRADDGSSIYAAADATWRHGYLFESERPWSIESVDSDLRCSWTLAHVAATRGGLRYHRIVSQIRPSISSLVSAGYGVLIGLSVGQRFLDLCGDAVYHGDERLFGGHAMAVAGYDSESVLLLNSWGRSHGEDGFCRVSWDVLGGIQLRSVWAIDAVPMVDA